MEKKIIKKIITNWPSGCLKQTAHFLPAKLLVSKSSCFLFFYSSQVHVSLVSLFYLGSLEQVTQVFLFFFLSFKDFQLCFFSLI